MFKKVTWFLVFVVLAVSCLNDPDCYNLNNNVAGISFRKMYDGKADTIAVIDVRADDTDSVFYSYKLVSGILFPLDFLTDKTTIYFQRPTGNNKLVLSYLSKAQFVSEDCGERFVLSDLKVESSDFDSTRLLTSELGKEPLSNLYLYRCPITNNVKMGFRQLYLDTDTIGKALNVTLNGVSADYSGLVYPGSTLSSISLPLNPNANSTTFTFDFPEGQQSIGLNYTKTQRALFEVCGEQSFFSDLSVTSSDFPIMKLLRDTIQDPPITNIIFQKCAVTNTLKIVFKKSTATNANNDTVSIKKITADYTPKLFYENREVSIVELPLNTDSDQTVFTFEFDTGVKTLGLQYSRTKKTYQTVCGELTEITGLSITESGFLSEIKIQNVDVKFPVVTNLNVVND